VSKKPPASDAVEPLTSGIAAAVKSLRERGMPPKVQVATEAEARAARADFRVDMPAKIAELKRQWKNSKRALVFPAFKIAGISDVWKARQVYDAALRSGWDSYPGAITAAHAGDVSRLVDCLRGCKPLEADDWGRLESFISIKWRRRLWPGWLEDILRQRPVNPDYALLADEVERIGRRRGGVQDDLVHDIARLVDVLLFDRRVSDRMRSVTIAYALVTACNECGAELSLRLRKEEDGDKVVEVTHQTAKGNRPRRWVIAGGDPDRVGDLLAKVRELLDHEKSRRHNPRARHRQTR
jgi:hypothetical protein